MSTIEERENVPLRDHFLLKKELSFTYFVTTLGPLP
jgi:hypothetical protein